MRRVFIQCGLLAILTAASACGGSDNSPSSNSTDGKSSITTLQSVDIKVGTGTEATNGRRVFVHYTGWLYRESAADHHGSQFDSSRDRGVPIDFVLGTGSVIRGWDQGLLGMKVGGQRTLTIPPSLAYGSQSPASTIPANSTLVFDVELMNVQ